MRRSPSGRLPRTPASGGGFWQPPERVPIYHPERSWSSCPSPPPSAKPSSRSPTPATRRRSTHQRRIITKLLNNPAAELVERIEDISLEGTAGAVFEIPADLISFRSKKRTGRELSVAERAEKVRALQSARAKAA
jgi:hypothetical protein